MGVFSTVASKHTASSNASKKWSVAGVECWARGTEHMLKPLDFLGLLLALANDHLWFQSVYFNSLSSYLILLFVVLNTGNKLPDKLESVTMPVVPKMSIFLMLEHIY